MNMIGAMRDGALPTQLIFSLSALAIHGYEPTSVRFFRVGADGTLAYLTDDDVAKAAKITDPGAHNRAYANVEIKFKTKGAKAAAEQTYRHILANLDDAHIKERSAAARAPRGEGSGRDDDEGGELPALVRRLRQDAEVRRGSRGVDGETRPGLAPKWGTPAGFEYETYGEWGKPNMNAAMSIAPSWKALFAAQPKRELKFRFGYPDMQLHGHLIIMTKKKA